jgi:hypothetical protein
MPYKTALVAPTGTAGDGRGARAVVPARELRFCHRPDDPNFSSIDLRHDVAFKDTNTCGVTPEKGQPGRADVADHHAGDAVAVGRDLRMTALHDRLNGEARRMPKIASYVNGRCGGDADSATGFTGIASCPQ